MQSTLCQRPIILSKQFIVTFKSLWKMASCFSVMQDGMWLRVLFLYYISCRHITLAYPTWLCSQFSWEAVACWLGLLQMRRSGEQLLAWYRLQTRMAAAAVLAVPIWMNSLLPCAGGTNCMFAGFKELTWASEPEPQLGKLLFQVKCKVCF